MIETDVEQDDEALMMFLEDEPPSEEERDMTYLKNTVLLASVIAATFLSQWHTGLLKLFLMIVYVA